MEDILGIDKKDLIIISMFMENPNVSQQEIAKVLKLSQPSVNVRVNKLVHKGLLAFTSGININKTPLVLSRVDFTATDPSTIFEKLKGCPHFVNGYTLSGVHNVSVYIVNESMVKIDEIVTSHIRVHPGVSNVVSNIVVKSVKDIIAEFGIGAALDVGKKYKCVEDCKSCAKRV